jgi:RNA polymerase sigma-70 factor (ECF subfamily)
VQAFDALYHHYADKLYRFAYNRLGASEDAQEAVQEIFLWIWENRENLGHIDNLNQYLFSALRHRIIHYFRHREVKNKYLENYTLLQSYVDNSTEEQQAVTDAQTVISHSLSSLPVHIQTAYRLSREKDLPISRIAEEMNISPRTVENYISLALKHLRASLGKVILFIVSAWL